jgi:malate synthase
MASWLSGNGCVPIFNLMEDAATAEISRAQIWQWIRHPRGRFADGRRIYAALVEHELRAELAALHESLGPEAYLAGNFDLAAELFLTVSVAPDFVDFLTLPAYEHLA